MFNPNKPNQISPDDYKKQRSTQLRQAFIEKSFKPSEAYKKAYETLRESYRKSETDGVYFKGERIGTDPNRKARHAIASISPEILQTITVSGIGSNTPDDLPQELLKLKDSEIPQEILGRLYSIYALKEILTTGEFKGWHARPANSAVPIFFDAPFILISNKDEPLATRNTDGIQKIQSLRTVLVNGVFEDMIDDLKNRFPGISFRTSEQIDNKMFDKKNEFVSVEDQIEKVVDREINSK